ncbi:hypothetical protein T439DRAFT_384504 [Meredithblackwellia eburnea MCA 4105]
MALRPPSTPRTSLLPTTSASSSSLPTPGRRKSAIPLTPPAPRSSSKDVAETEEGLNQLKEAMRRNDPARYSASSSSSSLRNGDVDIDSPTPSDQPRSTTTTTASTARKALPRSTTPLNNINNATPTPKTPSFRPRASLSTTTRPSLSSTSKPTPSSRAFPPSTSSSSTAPSTTTKPPLPKSQTLKPDDPVAIDVAGVQMRGTLRFLGVVQGKEGRWAGVELDEEWTGRGKNDGSVAGVQYFSCQPKDGLFLPLGKVTKLVQAAPPPPISTTTTTVNRPSPASPTKPRLKPRVSSPVKLSSTIGLATSTNNAAHATPKPKPRMSMGLPTPTPTARRSLAVAASGSTVTPRATGRPGSALGRTIGASAGAGAGAGGEVPPPLPNGRRTPNMMMMSGRITPSTPSATGSKIGGRRLSLASGGGMGESRPTTPSVRSFSRQSFASVSSRSTTSALSLSRGGGDGGELDEVRERERETRLLLEASEKVGREMERTLEEARERERALEGRVEGLKIELEGERKKRELVEAEARKEGEDEKPDESEAEQERQRLRTKLADLESQLVDSRAQTDLLRQSSVRVTREHSTQLSHKTSEIERLHELLEDAKENREDLEGQVEKLRMAGQRLCETYEERIAGLEEERKAEEERRLELEIMMEEKAALGGGGVGAGAGKEGDDDLATSTRSKLDQINIEEALAESEHLRNKMSHLEEVLEGVRGELDGERDEKSKIRTRARETELALRKEADGLREIVERSSKSTTKSSARIAELEHALSESQRALEDERNELEGLRSDATSASAANGQDKEKELQRKDDLIAELRDDLRTAEKELEKAQLALRSNAGRSGSLEGGESLRVLSTPTPTSSHLENTLHPSPSSSRKRDSNASSVGSRRSLGGPKDELAAMKEQIVGLKVIISTVTEENQGLDERKKELEKEVGELRDAHRALEATVENLMNQLDGAPSSSPSSSAENRRISSLPLQREIDSLKLQLAESEKKSSKEIKALTQEVSDLEALVENKIYREEELEDQLAKLKKLSGAGSIPSSRKVTGHERTYSETSSSHSRSAATNSELEENSGECEMCGEQGHEIDSCPIFAGSSGMAKTASSSSAQTVSNGAEFCDDCEEYGHSLEHCPLANEIF